MSILSFLRDLFKNNSQSPEPSNPSTPSVPVDSGSRIKGIDVYHGDDISSWSKIKAAGYEFVFIKCSEGATSSDPRFVSYVHAAKQAGLIVGAYHFMRYTSSGESQAKRALALCEAAGLGKDDFVLTCDWEESSFSAGQKAIVKEFLETIVTQTRRLPLIYCSDSVYAEAGSPSWFKNYPLWVARYGAAPKSNWWSFWQYTESGFVPGVDNKCDINYFKGTLADLKTFLNA